MAALRSMPRWAVCLALLVVAAEASHLDQMLAAHHRVRNVAKVRLFLFSSPAMHIYVAFLFFFCGCGMEGLAVLGSLLTR